MASIKVLTIAVTARNYKLVEVNANENEPKSVTLVTLVTPFGGITKAYPTEHIDLAEGAYDSDGLRFIVTKCTESEYEEFKAKATKVEEPTPLLQSLLDMAVSEIG